jgi:UDP-glucose 4-epimerase
VPFVTQTGIGIREELKVFGGDYNTPDGSAVRDYIHVVDLAQAHLVALDRLMSHKGLENYEFFNLGTGTGYSVLDIVNSFERVTGEKLNYKVVDRRPGDVEQIYSDTKLANEVLGWKAKLSLDEALSSAWEWQKNLRDKPIDA